MYALSLSVSSFSFSLPFILSIFSYTPSRVLYSFNKLRAVFSPTPLTPGMLSDESPIKAFKSTILAGSIPYVFKNS